jgi:MFS family permease
MLVVLRLIQGLALGGEYGGAATYVAEHAPDGKRGFFTSFIQTTATFGLFAALLIVIGFRTGLGESEFAEWGWRLPFLLSAILLAISLWIRMQLAESPVFQKMKDEGTTSKAPLTEAFGTWKNLKWVLVALLGAVAGQAVIWYTGQFYALYYLERFLKVDGLTANYLIAIALVIGTPFFVVFGWLSDKIGRKKIIMAGCALAIVGYYPLFGALTSAANPALAEAQAESPIVVSADPATCSFQFDPVGRNSFDTTGCDVAKRALASTGMPYENIELASGADLQVSVGDTVLPTLANSVPSADDATAFRTSLTEALAEAGYPSAADPDRLNKGMVVGVLTMLVLLVTMVYGPIAALLVELFPSRIRYTAMSLPYHIGNGWFGGFLPTIAFAMVAATGNIYAGLWYPIGVAVLTLVVGLLFLPETFKRHIEHDY